jgi:hypothetical protein
MTSPGTAVDELAFKGRYVKVQTVTVDNFTIAISGTFLRVATIKDEFWSDDCVTDPSAILSALKSAGPSADMFTFSQRIPYSEPLYDFYFEYDNVAAIPISTYDNWLKKQINHYARNKVRKAKNRGIVTRVVDFDDALVKGIYAIYNETPVRQGKKFWHYGKDIETVRKENETFLNKSTFIGAFLDTELVGFVKMVYVSKYAATMQVLSLLRHRDKSTANALVAKAVEICASKHLSHFIYGSLVYGNKDGDSLSDFKRSNGFQKIDIPKYFIPLTMKGVVALRLGLHKNPRERLPEWIAAPIRDMRRKWYARNAART